MMTRASELTWSMPAIMAISLPKLRERLMKEMRGSDCWRCLISSRD